MSGENNSYYFAGGGTGGHIYPAIAVAKKLAKDDPNCVIKFFCSERLIDKQILTETGFEMIQLPATGFSVRPDRLLKFYTRFRASLETVKQELKQASKPVIISCGGFVSAPVVWAARKMDIPVYMVNVDIVPGKANKMLARFAKKIFVQFETSASRFGKNAPVVVTGCPLRDNFSETVPDDIYELLSLDRKKKILLITGASSGSANINNAICAMVEKFSLFADSWQVVHLAGKEHASAMRECYKNAKMDFIVLDYYENIAHLLNIADLLVGRAGAVSVAEYIACGVPAVCMPYPYHKDGHQKLNASVLEKAGCGMIVEDKCDMRANADMLWPVLENLMKDEGKRLAMKNAAKKIAKSGAAQAISTIIIEDNR